MMYYSQSPQRREGIFLWSASIWILMKMSPHSNLEGFFEYQLQFLPHDYHFNLQCVLFTQVSKILKLHGKGENDLLKE